MTQAQYIIDTINDKSAKVDKDWCDKTFKEFPYFTIPQILFLQRNVDQLSEETKNEITGRIAICSPDRKALYSLIGSDRERFTSFYPEEKGNKNPDTDTTIDTFIKTFGNTDDREIRMLNQLIFNPVPEYSQILASEERENTAGSGYENPVMSDNDILINRFISRDIPVQHDREPEKETAITGKQEVTEKTSAKAQTPAPDSMLSESLAKIYIKQHKYTKALEIIKSISLTFPEKSIYFADQIRFLQKLIINEQFKIKN